jgi:hypothetical protein
MYLPVLTGFAASALTLMAMFWTGFLMGNDILYPSFILRALLVSWFSGLAFYGWSGFTAKTFYQSAGVKYVTKLEETVIEPNEIPIAELKRLVGNEEIQQMEQEL